MSTKLVWMLLLLITAALISGCIFDKDNKTTNPPAKDIIPRTNLPAGYTYSATHETTVPIGGSVLNATEGVYKYIEGSADIQVIKNDNPEALLALYKIELKKQYKGDYNPFQDISFNGHKATLVKDYSTKNMQQKPLYSVIWTNGSYMFIVFNEEPTDAQTVIALATATGY